MQLDEVLPQVVVTHPYNLSEVLEDSWRCVREKGNTISPPLVYYVRVMFVRTCSYIRVRTKVLIRTYMLVRR